MALDETTLQVIKNSGNPTQRRYAERIAPIRRDGYMLLVTLLLASTVYALPFLNRHSTNQFLRVHLDHQRNHPHRGRSLLWHWLGGRARLHGASAAFWRDSAPGRLYKVRPDDWRQDGLAGPA